MARSQAARDHRLWIRFLQFLLFHAQHRRRHQGGNVPPSPNTGTKALIRTGMTDSRHDAVVTAEAGHLGTTHAQSRGVAHHRDASHRHEGGMTAIVRIGDAMLRDVADGSAMRRHGSVA